MKLTVFGATGGTGSSVVRQALDLGHTVTAVVRDPARLALPSSPGLHVVTAGLDDPGDLAPALDGTDAVISAVGAGHRGPTSVCADTIQVIMAAMRKQEVRRLVAVSAAGAHTTGDGLLVRVLVKPILQRALRHPFADTLVMEDRIRRSDLDWTIVLPPRLTNGRRTGAVRSRIGAGVRGAFSISRADLADFLIRTVDDQALVRHAVSVAHA
ncbi:NAD(P)-dependent oxidoreductase [Saccharomonospora xinjiangensis]|uniref:Putative NADH-flavin reductase n=1 Tax=Saccharomonospora xinjiangensis XJ-54 TaxID=882086 RepID=I0UX07_9PSEU|nr:NAD(P)-binding oxidoreductase [Saccharomonospora xinjiangensis]EID52410.1 putative NADH-flavin reductase [Saccharomonospora xinjiangensis XJ-54]